METSVKWNLDEATEISVLSGWDIIRFDKFVRRWMYRVEGKPDVRTVTHSKLPALLEKYEAAGCGVLIATERKGAVLKLGEKMVEVSTKKFDWDDVAKIRIYRNGYECLKYDSTDRTDVEGLPIFNLEYRFDKKSLFTKSSSDWFVYEVEIDLKQPNNTEVIIFNKDGERMSYEQN